MEGLLQPARPVYSGSLIQGRVNACQCRQIDDGVISEILPYIADHYGLPEGFVAPQKINRLFQNPQIHQDTVEKSGAGCRTSRRQEFNQDSCQYYPGQKIRKIGDRLYRPFEPFHPYLIQKQGKGNRDHQIQNNLFHRNNQRIAQCRKGIRKNHQLPEILKTYKFGAEKSFSRLKILKGHENPRRNGKKMIDEKQHHRNEKHPVIKQVIPSSCRLSLFRNRFHCCTIPFLPAFFSFWGIKRETTEISAASRVRCIPVSQNQFPFASSRASCPPMAYQVSRKES